MIDVKKLIAGFLILATGASSSVLIFSYFSSPHAANNTSTGLAANLNSPVGNNAFKPQLASDDVAASLTPDVTNNPGNITGNLTNVLLNGIMAANPQGPSTDANGNPTMTPPDQAKMLTELSGSAALKNFKYPNWDIEANAIPLNIAKKYSKDDIAAYVQAISNTVDNNFIKSGIQNSLSQTLSNSNNETGNLDPSVMSAVTPLTANTLNVIVGLKTPAPFAGFQKDLVKLLVYEKNITQLVNNASEDPLKTSLTLNFEEKAVDLVAQDLQNELQKAIQGGVFALNDDPHPNVIKNGVAVNLLNPSGDSVPNLSNGLFSVIENLFIIKTANADTASAIGTLSGARATKNAADITSNAARAISVPVFDAAASAKETAKEADDWVTTLEKYAEALALQLLKNSLIYFIQNKALAWIQGSGAPRFVTQWASTLTKAYTSAAASYLNSITPQLCPQFGPLINVALQVTTPYAGVQTCTLGTPYNLQAFYNDFSSGGWNSYFNMLQPNNSFYSQLMTVQDTVQAAASNQQAATQAKFTASAGLSGDEICTDYSWDDPHGSFCMDDTTYAVSATDANGNCADTQSKMQNGGLCADGSEPQVVTPGTMTGEVSAKALGSSIDLVVNAKDLEGIAVALTESMMTSLMNSSQKYIDNSITGNPHSYTPAGGITSVSPSSPGANLISCNPASTTVPVGSPFTMSAYGGGLDADYNAPTYVWSAPGAITTIPTGQIFTAIYNTPGTYNVTVTASTDHTTATCKVNVADEFRPVLCSPATQTVNIGGVASATAAYGNTNLFNSYNAPQTTYSWSAPGASTTAPNGQNFTAIYNFPGTYGATVTASDNTTATCDINVQ